MTPNNNTNDAIDYEESNRPGQVPAPGDRSRPLLSRGTADAQRQAAVDVTRGQIAQIYQRENPYERSHAPESEMTATDDHFKKYHTAWQDYYQKYYEGYYTQAVRQTQAQLKAKAEMEAQSRPGAVFGAQAKPTDVAPHPASDTPHSAAAKLQSQFKEKVKNRAGSVRKSRHFWPLVTAVTVAGMFLFLQYNRLLIANVAAYVSPGSVDPQNIIVDPTTDLKVGPDPKIIIPKINVDAPVIYSVTTYDNNQIGANLKNGTVKYAIPGANAFPGQVGNLVIGGHSSNDVFDDGQYKFVFVQLEKLAVGDTMYLNYNSTRYTYRVSKTLTIDPADTAVLTAPVTTPTVTLITCTPVGTALHRFLVFAEQISPDPSGAQAATTPSTTSATTTSIPGNSPTFLQRIFGN